MYATKISKCLKEVHSPRLVEITMNKGVASLGIILVIIAAFLFYIVFDGGTLAGLVVTGTNATANFAAFLYVIIALPIGSGLAYAGLSYRPPVYAAGGQPSMQARGSGLGGAALAVGVIALIIGLAAIGVAFSYHSSTSSNSEVSSLSSQVASLNSEMSSLSSSGGSNLATVNQAPAAVPLKVDWCNTDNTGQDRFCPGNIVVNQGDIVQILFISNDTDAHTFTLDTSPYNFQINVSYAGAHFFDTNTLASGNCVNGTATQATAGISGTYCVSGSSLLTPSQLASNSANLDASTFLAQNADPAISPPSLVILNVNNTEYNVNTTSSAISAGTIEAWGIGAFQATQPGIYEYFCHYHVSNGMFGYLIVLPNTYCNTHASACNIAGS